MYQAEILADSQAPNGARLTTMRVTMPRFILAEMNTHRVFSRNAGSSRAIPISRRLKQVRENPVYPLEWGKNQKGMQATEQLATMDALNAIGQWEAAAADAAFWAEQLEKTGVHKQIVNRLLEPFSWVQVIVSSTEWDNFWKLRHPQFTQLAQPEMMETARVMKEAYDQSVPQPLSYGSWHLPGLSVVDRNKHGWTLETCAKICTGRMARVSYETEGKSVEDDIALAERLMADGHWSPFEHVAQVGFDERIGAEDCRNFRWPFKQFRAIVGG